jgi:hypothetical protein
MTERGIVRNRDAECETLNAKRRTQNAESAAMKGKRHLPVAVVSGRSPSLPLILRFAFSVQRFPRGVQVALTTQNRFAYNRP